MGTRRREEGKKTQTHIHKQPERVQTWTVQEHDDHCECWMLLIIFLDTVIIDLRPFYFIWSIAKPQNIFTYCGQFITMVHGNFSFCFVWPVRAVNERNKTNSLNLKRTRAIWNWNIKILVSEIVHATISDQDFSPTFTITIFIIWCAK